MKDKITLFALGVLTIIILGQSIQVYFLKRKTNTIFEEQLKELKQLKEENLKKADSIEILLNSKLTEMSKKEKLFYNNINKAKENNIRYEEIKKNISTNNDADSLGRLLTKRYTKG